MQNTPKQSGCFIFIDIFEKSIFFLLSPLGRIDDSKRRETNEAVNRGSRSSFKRLLFSLFFLLRFVPRRIKTFKFWHAVNSITISTKTDVECDPDGI